MRSIKKKLMLSYLGIIIFTVVVCEFLVISSARNYFYNNAKELMSNQIKLSADFYNTYLSSSNLKENVANDIDIFWKNTPAEVQLFDESGKLLMDSIGYYSNDFKNSKDILEALSGNLGTYIYKLPKSNETLMAISLPLKHGNNIEGVLRFVTSLKNIDKNIRSISLYLILLGIIVIVLSTIVSILISNKITKPIETITIGAKKMASGNFKEKIHTSSEDEFGQLANTLNYMSEEIFNSENLKNEFIASISHELRTPLTSIKGWAVALNFCDPKNKNDFEDGLKIIEQECDRLTSLVEELLDFSKLLSGKVSLKKEWLDLNDIINYMNKQLSPRAKRDNITLSIINKNPIPKIYADKNRLKQLFINILDNSFKFTEPGGEVTITTGVTESKLFISIKDNGCGISKMDLPRITEKFYKGKSSKSKNGIGLSICKEIVSLHEGDLKVLSQENKGTEVIITFPLNL